MSSSSFVLKRSTSVEGAHYTQTMNQVKHYIVIILKTCKNRKSNLRLAETG